MSVAQIMSTSVVTVHMDDTLKAVKDTFDNMHFHHLLVVLDTGRLHGILSDRDLLKAISPNIGTAAETHRDTAALNRKVHQIMSRQPVTIKPDAAVRDAVDIFNRHRISCIPVVDDDGRPVGVVSWRDILRVIGNAPRRAS